MELTLDLFRGIGAGTLLGLRKTLSGMIARCHNENNSAFPYYGARGIAVCHEWRENRHLFYAWAIASGYKPGLTIDRINNDLGYSPDNCRLATRAEQNSGRSKPCHGRRRIDNGPNGRVLKQKTSRFNGVSFCRASRRWRAGIRFHGKLTELGTFDIEEEAARAYDRKAKELYGEAAFQNFPVV